MDVAKSTVLCLACMVVFSFGCSSKPDEVVELKTYPIDTLDNIISQSEVRIDKEISSDGKGSARITTEKAATIKPYETGDLDIENIMDSGSSQQ